MNSFDKRIGLAASSAAVVALAVGASAMTTGPATATRSTAPVHVSQTSDTARAYGILTRPDSAADRALLHPENGTLVRATGNLPDGRSTFVSLKADNRLCLIVEERANAPGGAACGNVLGDATPPPVLTSARLQDGEARVAVLGLAPDGVAAVEVQAADGAVHLLQPKDNVYSLDLGTVRSEKDTNGVEAAPLPRVIFRWDDGTFTTVM